MKKTTLLIIGALAFVLQATAQTYVIYSENFEEQTPGNTPQNMFGVFGGNMWSWVGNASATTWDVENVASGEYSTYAAVLTWTVTDSTWTGFSSGDSTGWNPGWGIALSDMTFSIDIAVIGAGGTQPVAIWFDQFPGGTKAFDAFYQPVLVTDGSWNTVTFTLDRLVNNGGAYNPSVPFVINVDSGGTGMAADPLVNDVVMMDNIVLLATIPEPSTITLLTFGGLVALVAIRRRA